MSRIIILFVFLAFLLSMAACNKDDDTESPYRPFIVLMGDNPVWSPLGEPYEDAGAKAYGVKEVMAPVPIGDDEESGFEIIPRPDTFDISQHIKVSGHVNIDEVGIYQVRFNVEDDAGIKADEVVRTVYVNIF